MACRSRPKGAGTINAPIAARQLVQLLTGQIVNVVVAKSSALARPQKPFAVREKIKVVAEVDPILIGLSQNRSRRTRSRIHKQQIEPVLRAIHALNRNPPP